MEKMNPKIYMVIGVALIAVSIPLAAGLITPWPASETWEYTEVRAVYAPKTLEPGTQIKTVTVLAYNGWKRSGDVLIDVYIPGHSVWQFTEYVKSYTEANLTLSFYRSIPVMPEEPLTITAMAEMGRTQATATIYPAATTAEPTNTTDQTPTNSTDGSGIIDTITDLINDVIGGGNETDPTDSDDGADSGSEETGTNELAIIEYLQTIAPRLTVETLTMGIVTMMLGLGFSGYGFSMRDQW